uniref:Complement C3-like n=1 Tax=Castor canadensis TaxID=51338 RepID=A0A8B7UP80_CASCN|nr:complement C3-like [Castor canadensis]
MDATWPLGFILILMGGPLVHAEPLYILVTPRVMRVGSPENIHVQAHSDSTQPLETPLGSPLGQKELPLAGQTSLCELYGRPLLVIEEVERGLGFRGSVPESLVYPAKPGQQYIIIRVAWGPPSASSFMEKMVLVIPHAGYIFIQTDKTIYTPEHSVQYRVLTVNHKMDPVSRTFTLDIKNPEGITVTSQSLLAKEGLFASSFHLPELVSLGTWTIEASYQSAGKQKFKATFDVKEYVLPSFDVQLMPNKMFFHLNDESLDVDIQARLLGSLYHRVRLHGPHDIFVTSQARVHWRQSHLRFQGPPVPLLKLPSEILGATSAANKGDPLSSRYIFNKPVDGHALVIFGVKMDSRRIPIQSSLQRVEVSEGQGHISLQKDQLMAMFEGPEKDLLGASIFINVTVFSSGGGEMVQVEHSGVKIVETPYTIKFIRTPQYFKPGMPFHFRVFVSNPDGSPASGVLVHCQNHKVHTLEDGVASLTINTDANLKQLPISEKSGNFLHIEVKTLGTEVGSNIQLSLNTRHRDSGAKERITSFTIIVLSKGWIVSSKQQLKSPGSVYTSAIIDVTPDMLPSFRILAFYLLPRGVNQDPELVADSIWIDVNDRCMGHLKVGLKNDGFVSTLEPNSKVELKVTGDSEATVGLLAVDKAVYVLNSKHKLTQKKIWDVVEEHDIGCTAGSGKDRLAVFKDAGLDLKISTGMETKASSEWHCPQTAPPSPRRHRSLKRLETRRNAVNKFNSDLERKCCEAGFRESPVGLSCVERTRYVRHGPVCVAAFLDCCHLSETLTREAREEQLILGTSDEDDVFDDLFLDDMPVRTFFPESWLWRTLTLPKSNAGSLSQHSFSVQMPDSITTWQFVAISLKDGQGVCVSEPFELMVMKTFFVDLKLPSSVIRNEQVQIQAVLYNFKDQEVKVRVEFPHKEPLCSASKPGAPSRQVVVVPPTSTKMVPFVLLPLEIGQVDVEVKAVGLGVMDHVKKVLLVQAGGRIERLFHSIFLNPQGQTQAELVPRREFLNKVPGTQAEVFVSVQGDILGEAVLGSLTSREVQDLLTVPGGCPEQTLSRLAPVIILTGYLDATGQWGKVGVEHRDQVIKNIISGHIQMLTHRSYDGTYHVTKGSPGSTWLTSYVFRIFKLAYPIMTVKVLDLPSLCAMAEWIISQRQAEDGSFLERGPVVMASMQGGYKGSEADISLTALVLIALHEGSELCGPRITNLAGSLERARGFLETQLPNIQTTFAMAIASYALALANSPRANDRLDSFASQDKTHWPVGYLGQDSLYTVEATAYALMQKLYLGQHHETHAIAKWLLERRELGGGFGSTQVTGPGRGPGADRGAGAPRPREGAVRGAEVARALSVVLISVPCSNTQTTVVTLEALTRFSEDVPFHGTQDLRVQISVPKRALNVQWLINRNNAYQQRSAKVRR